MNIKELLTSQLGAGLWLFENGLADFSDEDARVQACAGAPHAIWMLMHVASSEDAMVQGITGGSAVIPEEVRARFKSGSTPDPKDPITKDAALGYFRSVRERTLKALAEFAPADLDQPAPPGVPALFRTAGETWGLVATHPFWHFGQLSVIRRMLGKRSLFG